MGEIALLPGPSAINIPLRLLTYSLLLFSHLRLFYRHSTALARPKPIVLSIHLFDFYPPFFPNHPNTWCIPLSVLSRNRFSQYDNEWGYSCRVVDLLVFVRRSLVIVESHIPAAVGKVSSIDELAMLGNV